MKRIIISAFGSILALCLFPSSAQVSPQLPQISVSGSAEIKVAPDQIDLEVGVESRNKRLDVARRDNDERISRVLRFLKSSGVPDKDVQTDFIGIHPSYESGSWSAEGYSVQKSIGITLRKIDNFEAVLTGLLTNGVNNVHGVHFRTSELRQHRDRARQLAIGAAREKADLLVCCPLNN